MKEIVIPVDHDILNIIYNCIIEHWRMPQYEEELSQETFKLLQELRERILGLRGNPKTEEIKLSRSELDVIVKAYEIGFRELIRDGGDFHPIVGHETKRGEEVLEILKSYQSATSQELEQND